MRSLTFETKPCLSRTARKALAIQSRLPLLTHLPRRTQLISSRVLGHGCFDWLFVYLVLIPVSCFVVLFSVLFRFQLSVPRPNPSQVVRIQLPYISVS